MSSHEAAEREIRGFLAAFEMLNNFTNHCSTFTFDRLPRDGDIDEGTPSAETWEPLVRRMLQKYLFEFVRCEWESRSDPVPISDALVLADEHGQRIAVDWLVERIRVACAPESAWPVPDHADDVVCDTVVVRGANGVFRLYLGFSD